MKFKLLIIVCIAFLYGTNSLHAQQKVIVPLTEDGAWSVNSQPSAIYYNGSSYFAWVNSNKSLVAASYNHTTGYYQEQVVATSFRGDFASPALLVRGNGQILLFSSKNEGEAHYYVWVTTNPEDVSQWSASKTGTAYGAGGTLPFTVGDDVYILTRSKNNVGVTYASGLNADTSEIIEADMGSRTVRSGLFSPGNGNDYTTKLDIPYMTACQGSDGSIHIVYTQLASGGTQGNYYAYNEGSIHYVKFEGTSTAETGLSYNLYKANGETISSIDAGNPPDIIFGEAATGKKAWAYDIQLDDEGLPVVLFASFNPDGTEHVYNQARWNNTSNSWEISEITTAGDGLLTDAYSANQSKFPAHALSSGGMNFASGDISTVYLSKRNSQDIFEIYKFGTNDGGATWAETEVLTTGTPSNNVNIRPKRIMNAPENAPIDLIWMKGAYTSPVDFSTAMVSRGNAVEPLSMKFEEDIYNFVVNDLETLNVSFFPIFVANRDFALESSNPSIVTITSDNKVKCLAIGEATITAKAISNPSITTTCKVVVQDRLVFDVFKERIIQDLVKDNIITSTDLDADVADYLSQIQGDGAFLDVDYSSTVRTKWPPMVHLDRLLIMSLAYTLQSSTYYSSSDLKAKIDSLLEFWQNTKPRSNNWWYNEIAEPQRMGQILILIDYLGSEKLTSSLLDQCIARLRDNGGNPAAQAGANRVDVALHYMYRACLTKDYNLLREAMDFIYSPLVYTLGSEGIQYDNSYTQHGRQLYTGHYGIVFMEGITKACMYAVNTDYQIPVKNLKVLSGLIKDSYASIFRGEYIYFNPMGRGSTRPQEVKKTQDTGVFQRMKILDPGYEEEYNNIILRISGVEAPNYNLTPRSIHYYKTDYSVHNRNDFSIDLRMVSNRTARNEILADNGEGLKQYFLSDGATGVYVDGDEYFDIFPVWDWAKIPGVTCPEYTTIPKASSYIKMGESDFVGGVTDSVNIVSTYQYKDTYSGINSSAKKSWFFFNNEVVCLGNDIKSTSGLTVNTTVNQCALDGEVVVSSNGNQSSVSEGDYTYTDLDWVYHDQVGYFFPSQGSIDLSAKEKTGDWGSINTNYLDNPYVTKGVFTLNFDHGVDPSEANYAYIMLPGVSKSEVQTYDVSKIEILVNSDSLQAVYHQQQKVYGLVFHKAASFTHNGFSIEAGAGCTLLLKDVDQAEPVLYVSDPQNGTSAINLGVVTPLIAQPRLITYQAESPYLGKSMKFVINKDLPDYTGRDTLLNKLGWIIKTSIEGPEDATIGGDEPEYIIDGDNQTAFAFVKPGKSFGGIDAAINYEPSFTIDMLSVQNFSFFTFRHRTDHSSSFLRASSVAFYGSNSEEGPFLPIVEDVVLATDVSEIKVDFPQVSYRYVKLVITGWDEVSGSTIQVSEFNIGTLDNTTLDIEDFDKYYDKKVKVYGFPNPVKLGQDLTLKLSVPLSDVNIEMYDIMGRSYKIDNEDSISTKNLTPGIYVLKISNKRTFNQVLFKFIVK
ncbi:polysaccharide lyase family 8 super-sandwich domain-containing protein [Aestuariibaculum marinum]|uniref:BNR-4 repeat-containing protein n=1 Tax=Aestuariibaculum marinum TaxID=2683592 RepID=A0A8J6QE97_9FLAO|nr:polysaccharide lyase family 8 super-sandwich domain-containing protein [Aestuariibaculum marinum]MBD0825396.1 BNR-4 repeat-containing protein [Aestuariibaculum marinum]